MTNAPLDIQPALRSPHVSVRGGRLTKFKGQVASIAPGLSIVAIAAVLLAGGVSQAAAQACGTPTNRQVTCDAGDNTANGITYNVSASEDLTVILDDPTVRGSGVAVGGSAADNVTVQMGGGTITTQGAGNNGIRVDGGATEGRMAKVVVTGGEINVDGDQAGGISVVVGDRNAGAFNSNAFVQLGGHSDPSVTASVFIKGQGSTAIEALVNDNESTGTATALLKEGGEIETKKAISSGLVASTRGKGGEVLAHMSGGKITTYGEEILFLGKPVTGNAHGVVARILHNAGNNSDAKATAKMTGGEIKTELNNSAGVRAYSNLASFDGEVKARMEGGKITTNGNQSHGLQAFASAGDESSREKATAVMTAGRISTHNINAHGIQAFSVGGGGEALVQMEGGSITTTDSGSYGVMAKTARASNTKGVKVEMTGGFITTVNSGNGFHGSHGIYATTPGSGDILVDMSEGDGTVTTVGRNSHGIFAEAEGVGASSEDAEVKAKTIVNLGVDATVTASGAGSDGIRVSGLWVDPLSVNNRVLLDVKEFDVDVAGRVTGGADGLFAEADGVAIRTVSDAEGGGTIDIASTAIVTAGGSGLAIVDGDGAAVVTSAGLIDGDSRLGAGDDKLIVTGGSITDDIHLGTGNDTLELKDGSITGDVYGGAGNDTMNLTGGRFNGDIHTGDGDDSVTIDSKARYDFSYILDGGTGDDELTLHGQTMTSMENVRNWESVTLSETTLRLDGTARLDIDQLSIDAGSAFRASGGGGGITIAGDVINNGSVILDVQDGNTGDVITVEGDYTGSGTSVFALDAALAGNDAETDRLVINGDASGEMMLSVTNLDSAGGEDTPLEIDVVSVGGASEGTFTLVDGNHVTADGEHGVISGAHLYRLAEAEDGRGWVLSAMSESGGRNWQPSAPIYDSYGQSLLALNGPASLRSRGSSEDFRSLAWDGGPADQNRDTPLWFQMGGERITSSEEHSTTGAALESSIWEMEIGADIVVSESGAGLLVGGLMFSYATGSASVSSEFGDGSIDTSGFGLGVAATWYDHRRFYVDGQVSLASYSSDLEADRIGTLTEGNGGTGLAFSIEAGQRFDLGSSLTVIPQAQLSLSSVAFDDFEGERYGEQVTLEDAASQQLRLGLEFGAQEQGAHRLYGIVNLFHEFGAGSEVNVAGATLTTESEPWAIGVGLGGNYALTDRVDLFGEASYATGLSNAGDASALSANAGLKVVF